MRDLRLLLGWLRGHRGLVLTTVVLQVLAALGLGAGIALLVPAVAMLLGAREAVLPGVLAPLADGMRSDRVALGWLAAVLVLLAVRSGLLAVVSLTTATVVRDVILDLRARASRHLLGARIEELERIGVAGLAQRANGEMHRVAQATKALLRLASQGGAAAVFGAGMLLVSWPLTLVVMLYVAAMLPLWRGLGRRAERFGRQVSTASRAYARALQELLWSMRVVRELEGGARERERLERRASARERAALLSSVTSSVASPITELLMVLGVAAVVVAASLLQGAWSEPTEVLVFLGLLSRLMPAVAGLSSSWGQLAENLGAVRSVDELFSLPAAAPWGALRIDEASRLELRSIEFAYAGSERPALDGVGFALERGENVALVGASGAGKSTLASILAGHFEPLRGEILLDGIPIRELEERCYRERVHVVPQNPVLFEGSIAENISYPETAEPAAVAAARAAGVDLLAVVLERGLDAPVGERGGRLSGGERQRVALARAFQRRPSFLVLDEAASALDQVAERRVQAALAERRADWGCLIIAHRPSSVVAADRILVLEDGRLVEQGAHGDLLRAGGEYARLYAEMERAESDAQPSAGADAALETAGEAPSEVASGVVIDNARSR